MTFYLIRHGQTTWNAQSRVMGRNEIPLDSIGENQVDELAQSLEHFPIQHIISSPQLRAQQTAQKIGISKNLPVYTDARVCELDFPRWQGKVLKEIQSDDVYIERKKDFFSFRHSEVESYESLASRAGQFIAEIEKKDQHVVVVSHADVIRAMIVKMLDTAPESFFQFKIQNASCSILTKQNDRWSLDLLNYSPVPLKGLNI